jgi:uncharacterized protein (TIGR03083 family)
MNGSDVLAAAAASRDLLEPAVAADWSAPVPGLDFTVASVVAHAANGVLWYALDIWGGPGDDAAFDLKVEQDAANPALLVSLSAAAHACAASVDAAPPTTRGFHYMGAADPSGFAAMACDELLVHTDDAARGLGVPFAPDPALAGRVLARLFPWHARDAGVGAADDPWRLLLWANGRIDLPGRPSQANWRWHCAPLSDWNGLPPADSSGAVGLRAGDAEQRHVQAGAGLRVVEADPEDALDQPEPLVERRAGQVGARGGEGLVAAGLEVRRQVGGQGGVVLGVVAEQRAELAVGERAQPGIVAQHVHETAQPQVG